MAFDIDQFREWVREYSDNHLDHYKDCADKMEEIFLQAIKSRAPLAIVQAREKAVPSFAGKIVRRNKYYDDPLRELTDLCGARVIVNLKEEADAICRFVRENFLVDEANSMDAMSRLRASEFGYRSVHYVVQFRRGVFDIDEELYPCDERPMKVEIQIRTMAQHAWADMGHDRLYKSPFDVPKRLERESARISAIMEKADEGFEQLAQQIDMLMNSTGIYHEPERRTRELEEEIRRLDAVREFAPTNAGLLNETARLWIVLERWDEVIKLLNPTVDWDDARLLSHLGYAMCRRSRDKDHCLCENGRALQRRAIQASPKNVRYRSRLASSWLGVDDARALEEYAKAFHCAPCDPETLTGYLRLSLSKKKTDVSLLTHTRTSIESAVERCRDQAEVSLNLPDALNELGELELLLGYCRRQESQVREGEQASDDPSMSEVDRARRKAELKLEIKKANQQACLAAFLPAATVSELRDAVEIHHAIKKYARRKDDLPAYEAVEQFLLLARDAKVRQQMDAVLEQARVVGGLIEESESAIPKKQNKKRKEIVKACRRLKDAYLSLTHFDPINPFYADQEAIAHLLQEAESDFVKPIPPQEGDAFPAVNQDEVDQAWKVVLQKFAHVLDLIRLSVHGAAWPSEELKQAAGKPIATPVTIIAGGCDHERTSKDEFQQYGLLLQKAFRYYQGTIISGGTREGVSGLVGELTELANRETEGTPRILSIGQLPAELLPGDATIDRRYSELRKHPEPGFTASLPLQYWTDIIGSGIHPSQVVLVGINGGELSAFEYRLASMLGAAVVVFESSGREADVLQQAVKRGELSNIKFIMRDPMTLCALLPHDLTLSRFNPEDREMIAQRIHKEYCDEQLENPAGLKPALKSWKDLPDEYKASNFGQAEHIIIKLAAIGKTIRKAEKPTIREFTKEEKQTIVEMLSEMEHGRWNAEKIMGGWTYGKERDEKEKIHDCLQTWEDLPEKTKKWDRSAVKHIPMLLADAGYEIVNL